MKNESSCLWPSIDTGTGKTTYIAAQIERAVEKHGAENVIVSSFTKAAATELNRRNLPIPKENIGTLHALCYRALGNFKYEIAELKAQEFNEQYPEAEITVSGKSQMDEMAADMVSRQLEMNILMYIISGGPSVFRCIQCPAQQSTG